MSDILEKTNRINEMMADLVYQIAQQQSHQELYRQAVDVMLQVSELENIAHNGGYRRKRKGQIEVQLENLEIRKVSRKLLRWADHPEQVNARLLTHFLELKRQGVEPVTKSRMEQFADQEGIKNFNSNFFGMSNIGEKNHGKVFDLIDGAVTIWPQVADAVAQFEEVVTARQSEKKMRQELLDSVVQQQNELQVKIPEPQHARPSENPVTKHNALEPIYQQFKALWLKKIYRDEALDELQRAGIQESSAVDHLNALEAMMRGESYPSPISSEATGYFIEKIRTDFSRGYLERARQAVGQHLDEQQKKGNPQPDLRTWLEM